MPLALYSNDFPSNNKSQCTDKCIHETDLLCRKIIIHEREKLMDKLKIVMLRGKNKKQVTLGEMSEDETAVFLCTPATSTAVPLKY
jgi:hypothetical protein